MGNSATRAPDVEVAAGVVLRERPAKQRRGVAILSFDGGGSRGVMECVVLDAIFKLVTAIIRQPNNMPR